MTRPRSARRTHRKTSTARQERHAEARTMNFTGGSTSEPSASLTLDENQEEGPSSPARTSGTNEEATSSLFTTPVVPQQPHEQRNLLAPLRLPLTATNGSPQQGQNQEGLAAELQRIKDLLAQQATQMSQLLNAKQQEEQQKRKKRRLPKAMTVCF